MYKFRAKSGLRKPSTHILERLSIYCLDPETETTIPLPDSIASGRLILIRSGSLYDEYATQEPYILVTIEQRGYGKPPYTARYFIQFGNDHITRIDTFIKGPLFLETNGNIMTVDSIVKNNLTFACTSPKTAPRHIIEETIKVTPLIPDEERSIIIPKNNKRATGTNY